MIALLLAGVALCAQPDPKVPVALVAGARGPVSVERGKDGLKSPEGGPLLIGDKLSAREKGELVVIMLTDGKRLRVKPGRAATVREKGLEPTDAVEEVDGPRADPATLKALQRAYLGKMSRGAGGVVLRGPADEKVETRTVGASPLFKAQVLTDHPTLSWPAKDGAKEYLVELFDGKEGEVKPRWRATTTDTRLPYPEEEKVLDKGAKYRWRVSRMQAGKEEVLVESSFFVTSDRLTEQVFKVRRLADGGDAANWLLAADLYDELGVYGKALPLYEKLAMRFPEAASYQVALARYYALAGRDEDAKKARARAKELGADLGGK